ncbi:hypothetical protein FQN60_017403 [Etheostoma spectabile]|uniref:Transmembrane protein n=1 Tax=Etheostoma spectabile TaxID=54343 RepID=A0A5J5DFL5_9PERO|nr:hypothetical protein FQN60_017403 [Etheostoma spectabile]
MASVDCRTAGQVEKVMNYRPTGWVQRCRVSYFSMLAHRSSYVTAGSFWGEHLSVSGTSHFRRLFISFSSPFCRLFVSFSPYFCLLFAAFSSHFCLLFVAFYSHFRRLFISFLSPFCLLFVSFAAFSSKFASFSSPFFRRLVAGRREDNETLRRRLEVEPLLVSFLSPFHLLSYLLTAAPRLLFVFYLLTAASRLLFVFYLLTDAPRRILRGKSQIPYATRKILQPGVLKTDVGAYTTSNIVLNGVCERELSPPEEDVCSSSRFKDSSSEGRVNLTRLRGPLPINPPRSLSSLNPVSSFIRLHPPSSASPIFRAAPPRPLPPPPPDPRVSLAAI